MDLQFGQRSRSSTRFRKYFRPNVGLQFWRCLASVLVVYSTGVFSDECLDATDIQDTDRRNESSTFPTNGSKALCDMSLDTNLWYYFGLGNRRCQMTESCAGLGHCGTTSGLWLNANHPTARYPGPVQRWACSRNGDPNNCCGWSDIISIKWCWNATTEREYFVYKLVNVPGCDNASAYCVSSYCGIEPDPNRGPYPPMTAPVLSPLFVSYTQDVNGSQIEVHKIRLTCTLGFNPTTTDDGARFEFQFYADNVPLGGGVADPIGSNQAVLNEEEVDAHIGSNIYCTAFSYWSSSLNVSGPTLTSNTYPNARSPILTTSLASSTSTTSATTSQSLVAILLGVLIPVGVIVIVVVIVVCVARKRNWCKRETTEINFENAMALDNYEALRASNKISSSGGDYDKTYDQLADPIESENAYSDQIVSSTNEENKYDYPDLKSELDNGTQ